MSDVRPFSEGSDGNPGWPYETHLDIEDEVAPPDPSLPVLHAAATLPTPAAATLVIVGTDRDTKQPAPTNPPLASSPGALAVPLPPLPPPPKPWLNAPELGDRFVVLSSVGKGTFSIVYKALDLHARDPVSGLPRVVAVKRVHKLSAPSRMLREAEFLEALGGCHVSVLLDVLCNDEYTSFVLPYFEHRHFKEYFGRMSVRDTQWYMRALFEALAHLHAKGVVHRDVKPSNFLQSTSTKPAFLLIDFGLAEWLPTARSRGSGKVSASVPPLTHAIASALKPTARVTASASGLHHKRKASEPTADDAIAEPCPAATAGASDASAQSSMHVAAKPSVPVWPPTAGRRRGGTSASALADSAEARVSALLKQSSNKLTPLPTRYGEVPGRGAASAAPSAGGPRATAQTPSQHPATTTATVIDVSRRSYTRSTTPCASGVPSLAAITAALAGSRSASRGQAALATVQQLQLRHANASKTRGTGQPPKSLRHLHTPRAGTRGFRAPEVLAKVERQTGAIDVWSAGVILVSILSACYPTFQSLDDDCAGAEFDDLLGALERGTIPNRTAHVSATLPKLRRLPPASSDSDADEDEPLNWPAAAAAAAQTAPLATATASDDPVAQSRAEQNRRASQLRAWCRARAPILWPPEVYALAEACLRQCPRDRFTAEEALAHPFFQVNSAEWAARRDGDPFALPLERMLPPLPRDAEATAVSSSTANSGSATGGTASDSATARGSSASASASASGSVSLSDAEAAAAAKAADIVLARKAIAEAFSEEFAALCHPDDPDLDPLLAAVFSARVVAPPMLPPPLPPPPQSTLFQPRKPRVLSAEELAKRRAHGEELAARVTANNERIARRHAREAAEAAAALAGQTGPRN